MDEVGSMAGAPGGETMSISSVSSSPSVPPPPPGARQVSLDEVRKWPCVYPAYINANLTVAQGRRLPKSKLVDCECFPSGDRTKRHDFADHSWPRVLLAIPSRPSPP